MPARARIIAPSLAALGSAALLTASRDARAEQVVSVSPALTFSVSFGQKIAFGLGLDVRVTGLFDNNSCSNDSRHGVGGFAQVTWLNFSAWRFAGGVQGGGEAYKQIIGANGEIGWTYRTKFGDAFPAYHGIQLGATALFSAEAPLPSMELPVRVAIPLSGELRTAEVIPGLGVRFPQLYGFPQTCIEGRPVRGADGMMLPGAFADRERRTRKLDRELDRGTRAALGDAWLDDARGECAAITAFLALSRDLANLGAPASLIHASLVAADDEVRHTLLCNEVSGGISGLGASPALLDPPPARDKDRRDALLRLALEAWVDGCVGEGAAAERARRTSRQATDPAARAAQAAIAIDEAQHAELGWSVLRYAIEAGGSEVKDALAELSSDPHREPPRGDPERDADPRALRDHGRLSRAEADAAWLDAMRSSRQRAMALLASS